MSGSQLTIPHARGCVRSSDTVTFASLQFIIAPSLGAAVFALLLSMFVGAPAVMVLSLLGCCCCKCWKCCRGGCCGPKPEEAPEDYAALSDAEKQPSSLLAASQKS